MGDRCDQNTSYTCVKLSNNKLKYFKMEHNNSYFPLKKMRKLRSNWKGSVYKLMGELTDEAMISVISTHNIFSHSGPRLLSI